MALQTPAATEALASDLVLEGALPNSDKGIAAIVDLAKRSMTPIVVNVPVPHLGPGLPKQVPVVIDMRTGSPAFITCTIWHSTISSGTALSEMARTADCMRET